MAKKITGLKIAPRAVLGQFANKGGAARMETQRHRVLVYLKTHDGITSIEAFEKFRATRLSSIIFDLRRGGNKIVNVWKQTPAGVRYVMYRLAERDGGEDEGIA